MSDDGRLEAERDGGEPDPSVDPSADPNPTGTLPPCPHCGTPVATVVSRGPDSHRAVPCRCRLGRAVLESLESAE